MYNLLIKLMLIAALAEFGMSLADLATCHSRECARQMESHSRAVLRVNWRPISMFPKEAKRFQSSYLN